MLGLICVEINLSKHSNSTHIVLNLLDSRTSQFTTKILKWNKNYLKLKLVRNIMYLHI